jgi:hypothetical protein
MKRSTLLLLGLLATFLQAEEPTVLSQKRIGKQSCGPCAFINSLRFAGDEKALARLNGTTPEEKARHFISRYASAPSIYWKQDRKAYSKDEGINPTDLIGIINTFRKQQQQSDVEGQLLIKRNDENSAEFLDRIHRIISKSIAAGFPPILDIRSSVASKRGKSDKPLWYVLGGHWVCLVSVTKVESDNPLLMLRLADSYTGKIIGSLMCSAPPRKSKVAMRYRLDALGKEKTTWIESSECLFLSAPGMPLGTQKAKWEERTYLNARYLIWCPGDKKQPASD